MAKDYFQDIIPPDDEQRPAARTSEPTKLAISTNDDSDSTELSAAPEKSIRNIGAPQRVTRARTEGSQTGSSGIPLPPKPRRIGASSSSKRWWLWLIAVILVAAVVGLALFVLRKTTVTVVPRSHTIVFDQAIQFTAYPAATAASGTLAYTITTSDIQDSQVVPAQGTQHVVTKSQGTVTVYNDYSSKPVKLIKNTRFATASGLVFRIQNDIVVPGKVGTVPGHVSTTVYADQAGDQYNIGPTPRFTIPGLQSSPAMYANMYAQSNASTTGGFVGDQPAADPAAVQKAQADIRGRIEQKVRQAALAQSGSAVILPDLIQISYQDLPPAKDSSGGVQIAEQAHVVIPIFDQQSLAYAVAQSVGTDTAGASLAFLPGKGFAAASATEASTTLGVDPLMFSLSGTGTVVWQVDTAALAQALAGHDQAGFTTIVNGFPGVQEAHARIEPFWKSTFPQKPADINVVVATPQASQ